MSLFSFLFWWERSCQPVKCWSAARPQEEDLQPWPEEKVWKERLQQLRQDWETKRLCKMQVTSHFFFFSLSVPISKSLRGFFVALSVICNLFKSHPQALESLDVFFASFGIHLLSAHTVSHITPCDTLHWVSMPGAGSREGAARAASVRKRMGMLCARKSKLPTGHTSKPLSQPGHTMEKRKEWKEKLQVPCSPWRKPGWSRYPHCSPWRKHWIFLEGTTSHGQLLVEKNLFCEGCRPMGSTHTAAGEKPDEERVSERNCYDHCYDSCLPSPCITGGSREGGRGEVWNEDMTLNLAKKKKEGSGRSVFLIFVFADHYLELFKSAIT